MLSHNTSLNKFRKTETITSVFSNHDGIKLEIKTWKIHKYVEIRQHTSKQPMNQTKNQKQIKKYTETNKRETQHSKTYVMH